LGAIFAPRIQTRGNYLFLHGTLFPGNVLRANDRNVNSKTNVFFHLSGVVMREKKGPGGAALSKVQKLKKRLSQSFGKLGERATEKENFGVGQMD
jgi:hypothetical protein